MYITQFCEFKLVVFVALDLTWSNKNWCLGLLLCFQVVGLVVGIDLVRYFGSSTTLVLKIFVHLFGEVFPLIYL